MKDEHAAAKADLANAIEIEWTFAPALKLLYLNYLDEIEANLEAGPRSQPLEAR